MKFEDLTGKTFGRLRVLYRGPDRLEGPDKKRPRVVFICECACGKIVSVRSHSLLTGKSQSCGCLRIDLLKTNAHKRKDASSETLRRRAKHRSALAYKRHLQKKYGLSYEEFQRMVDAQHNECAICGEKMNPPNVDHHHESNTVRELLCGSCNQMLGNARERIYILKEAILYLRRHHGG